MPRILFISRCPPYPLHFGDRLILWHLARILSERGYTLDLLALTQEDSDAEDVPHYAPFFDEIQLFPETHRTKLMYIRRLVGAHYPTTADDAWQPQLWNTLETRLNMQSYDIIHLFGGVHVYEFAHLLAKHATIITPYESYSLYLKRALLNAWHPLTWLNRQLTRQFERWMFAPYGRTVVLTEEDKAELQQINPTLKVDVIPNGVNLDDFVQEERVRDAASLLFVGNYTYPPNHDAALLLATEIFPQVQSQLPEAELYLVGNAPPDDLQAMDSAQIHVTGRVPSVQDYLSTATIFVCPLRVGAGIKNKVLEAMAMGIPTVATPLSMEGIAAIHGEHVLVADVGQMAEIVIQLLHDRPLQKRLSRNAPVLIREQYDWRGVVSQYEALYQAVQQ